MMGVDLVVMVRFTLLLSIVLYPESFPTPPAMFLFQDFLGLHISLFFSCSRLEDSPDCLIGTYPSRMFQLFELSLFYNILFPYFI